MSKQFPYKGALQGISVNNGLWPERGPYITETYVFDLNTAVSFMFSLGGPEEQKQIGLFQSVFLDNSLNIYSLSLLSRRTEFKVTIPPNSQAILPIFAGTMPSFELLTTAQSVATATLQFLNIPQSPIVWKVI